MRLLSLPPSLLALCFSFALAQEEPYESGEPHYGMQRYLSRPDIEPARWDVTVYDRDRLAPGYWFVSPYEKNGNKLPGGSWIGPHIYDDTGELIWSGSHLFNNINVMDFKVANVGGKDMLSMLYAVEGNAYLLDNAYKVQETVFTGETGVTFNMHDFHTVDDGSRYLYLQRNVTRASREMSMDELGYDGMCSVTFPGFEERDVKTKEILYTWTAEGHLHFNESTMDAAPVESRCDGMWDYLHSNAIDKFNDGHYLMSTRHSDTVYKISKDDGSVLWRLHGTIPERSDFEMIDLGFSRQHHARLHENNDTHVILTILDNAVGADAQPRSHEWSRALKILLRLDTEPMTAELMSYIDHPKHGLAFRRGSHQLLPNGNTMVGWSEHAFQSEHAPDGEILMEANLVDEKLGTYRAFKFPFVAAPDYPPDVYSVAASANRKTKTTVYVSWNGATEVSQWKLYKVDANGKREAELTTVPRSGFETAIEVPGYASHVQVEALDIDGNLLDHGVSEMSETNSDDVNKAALAEEEDWLSHYGDVPANSASDEGFRPDDPRMQDSKTLSPQPLIAVADEPAAYSPILTGLSGMFCSAVIFFCGLLAIRLGCLSRLRRGTRRGPRYSQVKVHDAAEFDEAHLDDLTPRTYEPFKVGDDEDEDEEGDGGFRTPSTGRNSGG